MGGFIRRIVWFIAVAGLAYVAYVAYVRWWDEGLTSRVKETIGGFWGKTTEQVAERVTETVEERAREYASSVIGEAEGAVTRYVRKKAAEALTSFGAKISETAETLVGSSTSIHFPVGMLPIATGTGFLIPPPPATVVTKTNTPLVFSVTRGVSYVVEWGDGTREAGAVPSDAMQLLSHAWKLPGDYAVTIVLTAAGRSETYRFPIRIYE